MFNIHIVMPSGAQSVGYNRAQLNDAQTVFDTVVRQLSAWPHFSAQVVMDDDGQEIRRVKVENA